MTVVAVDEMDLIIRLMGGGGAVNGDGADLRRGVVVVFEEEG